MAEITPTPERGSWVKLDPVSAFREQPERGSWVKLDPVSLDAKKGWHVGRVVF